MGEGQKVVRGGSNWSMYVRVVVLIYSVKWRKDMRFKEMLIKTNI